MTADDDVSGHAIGWFRTGAVGVVLGVTLMGMASAVSQDISLTVEQTRATVPPIHMFSLPSLELSFSLPPMESEEALARWMATQVETAIHGLLVVTYYLGAAGALGGGALIGSGLVSLHRSRS